MGKIVNNSFSSEYLKTTDQDEPRFVKDTDQDGELDMDEVGDGRSLQHHWEQNGKLAVELISFIHHPIWELIQDADDRWAASISTAPKTAADFFEILRAQVWGFASCSSGSVTTHGALQIH
ncbi:EF-Hand 1, calcium-binding site [Phaffia rhodozyma]|uniref:EF-Hand 1, calcium-binding site n=1 Tax=Phaffia rhodozyma TaxID=264483 RepID=A0A0F7SL89_PHARH|nr:EF-Hand 1, calcium-binding site [Phaffia rhodozyma]